jgi:hypothetical protein
MKLTKRGEIVLALGVFVLIGLMLKGAYEIINHIWWVEGEGYCWGTIEHCMKGKL